jgi:hypothetical protein
MVCLWVILGVISAVSKPLAFLDVLGMSPEDAVCAFNGELLPYRS